MAPEKKGNRWNRIPISFMDSDKEDSPEAAGEESTRSSEAEDEQQWVSDMSPGDGAAEFGEEEFELDDAQVSAQSDASTPGAASSSGGPEVAELVATRAELKRLESEVKDLKDSLARRQADFENYRKRMERERSETYNRVVADIAAKLLPVLDNLKRALDTEASVEASESDEFRHFLSGVDLIYKQLNGVLDALGVKPVLAEGEQFDPHLHEAVVTEPTDDYEPDTVIQEIVRGFRLGDKLIRPALVKVAVKK
ncbi:MAG TPA: nucleotide exchange factor GrpE [Blastocatellia bacterium]|jgi:molecular chaperone GrpE|nr:nucleotide exchange factor GrpE [Blastocatellia bacterium]HCX32075.1 nucleotide exchange factor GrpE [Blastocatellia bacterium]